MILTSSYVFTSLLDLCVEVVFKLVSQKSSLLESNLRRKRKKVYFLLLIYKLSCTNIGSKSDTQANNAYDNAVVKNTTLQTKFKSAIKKML